MKFAKACRRAGIRPVLGVNLAYRWRRVARAEERASAYRDHRKTPVRGGAFRDLPVERGGLPRATFLAAADTSGGLGRGGRRYAG